MQRKNTKILIIGDFNLNEFDWNDNILCQNHNNSEIIVNLFVSYLGFKQFNNVINSSGRILDLIFSNLEVVSVTTGNLLILHQDNYHPPIEFLINHTFPTVDSNYIDLFLYNFDKCNYQNLCNFLSGIILVENLKLVDLDLAVNKFYEILNHTIEIFVPKMRVDVNYSLIWANPELRKLINLKKIAHQKYKLTKNYDDYCAFSNLRKECKTLSIQCNNNYIIKIEMMLLKILSPFGII